jgi:hypothetical protein
MGFMKRALIREISWFFLSAIILLMAGSAFARLCPKTDLTEDCKVDLADLGVFVDQWLNPEMCDESGVCADFLPPQGVDFIDFSVLMNDWLWPGTTLVINEFMASNNSASGIHDPFGDYDDWIEIHNYGDTPIDLAGMFLTDDLGNPTKWQIPSGFPSQTKIAANGYLVFWADDETTEGPLHTNFKLSGSGEEIGLFDTDGITPIDTIVFGEQTTNIAYGRDPNIIDNWRFFPSPTPGAINNGAYLGEIDNVEFSHKRGFYTSSSPFNLTIACVTPGANIYYTTDGRSPVIGEVNTPTSIRYTTPIAVNSTKFIRAAATKTGWMPSRTETNTYVFDANSYQKSIPIMAIVGDPNESLWEPNGVMSVNHRGYGYEKPASLEVLDVNNAGNDYQIDCGLRIHGNSRYSYTIGDDWLTCWINNWEGTKNYNKFSFRFYFRSIYGNNRFDYPFFTYTPEVSRQQCIVLRGGGQDTCTPFIKDEFWRRVFKQLDGVQLTGRVVNLYINGVYKAYFNPCGRDNAQFFQEFFGSDNDFDVIVQLSGAPPYYTVRDGNSIVWDAFLNYIDTCDLSIPANYDYVAGKLDITDFIDFLIVQIHSGNYDWPNNNWSVNREKAENGKFRFSIWDAEGTEQWYFGTNCEQCADTAFDKFPNYVGGSTGLNGGPWPISRIYRALKANPEFRQLFADRIHKHYKNNGRMTAANLLALWNTTINEVKPVLPAYDGYVVPPFIENVFLPKREPYVLAAFDINGLYNRALGAPVFNVNGSYKFGGYVSTSDTFTMTDPCSSGGTIYYTLDGSDPRVPYTASVSPTAITYSGGFAINKSTDLKARIYKSSTSQWSALNEAVYTLANVGQNLRITEIMYNLANTGQPNDEDSEYIELKNVGASAINLNLTRLTKGVDFTFGPNTLAAGQYILVVKDINAFTAKYGAGLPIAGQYDGSLNNAGENIRLKDANGTNILDFDFKDGWRSNTDGDGYSLTIINPTDSNVNHWGNKDYWRSSAYVGGSPSWDDSGLIPNPGSIVINEVLAHSHDVASDWIELRNTTGSSINVGGWYLSDSDSNLMKYRFSTGTTIPANGYLTVYESNNFGPNSVDPNKLFGFALSENGDMVCLTSALDSNGFLTGYREKEDFGASETGVSFGRYYKASTNNYNFVSMDANTPGTVNSYPEVGPIIITEIMYDPNWPTGGNYANDEYEYIELRNTSGSAVTLYDSTENEPWAFTDGIDYTFPSPPSAVTIAAGARILVVKNPTAFNWRYPGLSGITYGPYTGWLANDGEKLELSKPGDVNDMDVRQYIRVERVDYSDGSHPNGEPGDVDLWPAGANGLGKSLIRTNDSLYGNDPNNWTAATPTPGT